LKRRSQRLIALLSLVWLLGLAGCATQPPRQLDDLCKIFEEKSGWYKDARRAEKRWDSPIPVMMAIVYQESRFVAKAKPPRTKFLWIFPGPRPSSAYGYSQAKDETWENYRRASGRGGADRNDFDDAIDFVGWYNAQSRKRNGIANTDAHNLYLAYHEGHGGFERRTYRDKVWLKDVAREVSARATRYHQQLTRCREELDEPWWWPF
jgi:hypothetical protein